MDIMKEFYNKLPSDKIKINWNKNPIKMSVFLSFLTVPVSRSTSHLGSDMGWTLLKNKNEQLVICGGIIKGIEYLDNLQFRHRLSNPYNNYVNPFHIWKILNNDGKKFFTRYYKNDILKIINNVASKIKQVRSELLTLKHIYMCIQKEIAFLDIENIITQ